MKLFITISLLIASLSSFSQTPGSSIKDQLAKDWERAKAYTIEYLDAMPAGKYGFRPNDSIRTFSEQMLHLAQSNIAMASNGTGVARIFPGRSLERAASAQTKDSVVYYVNASYDFAIDSIKSMDEAKLTEVIKRGTLSETGFAWLLKGFEHQTHHRGQTTIYIRLQGIKPPAEKLF